MAETVLLTGASSFTGLWIAEALVKAGFEVIAPLLRPASDYDAERMERITRVQAICEVVFDCPFGSPALLDLIARRPIDALAHHAADVTGYRDPEFDAAAAFARNMDGGLAVFRALGGRGCRAALVTGTVFEAGEGGAPDEPLAVTPYGLSKTLTNIAFQHYADWTGLQFGRLVVPSPYGPFEQRRFPWYLFRNWFAGEVPTVRTPLYLRDHIPGPLLGLAYADQLRALLDDPATPPVHRPSGWIASQADFALKVAQEAATRLGRDCPVALAEQMEFAEPLRRVNSDPSPADRWDEPRFWDDYVGWYVQKNAAGRLD
jgi:UDP-glucose 4-epimerase